MMGRPKPWKCGCPRRSRRRDRAGSTTVKALQGGADYTTRFTLGRARRRDGPLADLRRRGGQAHPAERDRLAVFGKIGMSMTRKALAKDLAEIAAKAESL